MAPTTEPGEAGLIRRWPRVCAQRARKDARRGLSAARCATGWPACRLATSIWLWQLIGSFADAAVQTGFASSRLGLSHGTVTVLDPANADRGGPDRGGPVEVTQTRVDLETDGRHAVVGFSDDWKATRRAAISPSTPSTRCRWTA